MPRKVRVAMSADEPKGDAGDVLVWVRDGWSVTDREVREDAQRAGTDSALVLVWIPKEQADELRSAMVEAQAAKATVELRAVPSTDDGRNARAGLISRRDDAQEREKTLARRIVAAARVYQGGGNEVAEPAGIHAMIAAMTGTKRPTARLTGSPTRPLTLTHLHSSSEIPPRHPNCPQVWTARSVAPTSGTIVVVRNPSSHRPHAPTVG